MTEKQVAAQIGARIRKARAVQSMTLAALAKRTRLSEGFLSRVERGEASSSIANLVQICAALGLGLQDLLGESEQQTRTEIEVYRGTERTRHVEHESSGYHWHRVAGGAPRDRMEVFHLVFPRKNKMPVMVSHPGQEHCYVLSGEVLFFVGGEHHHLRAGDGIFIASEQPHRAENAGEREAHVLMTVSKPENEPAALDWWRLSIASSGKQKRKSKAQTKEETS
jgi:quercetin dioxygenase-like cupin family protein/DNA-binding Xre family transcriptional regulator